MLLPVHSCPGKLCWFQSVVEVPLTFWIGKQENLQQPKDDDHTDEFDAEHKSKPTASCNVQESNIWIHNLPENLNAQIWYPYRGIS